MISWSYSISTMKCGLNTLQIPFPVPVLSFPCPLEERDWRKFGPDWLSLLCHGHWQFRTALDTSCGHDEERHIRRQHVVGRDCYISVRECRHIVEYQSLQNIRPFFRCSRYVFFIFDWWIRKSIFCKVIAYLYRVMSFASVTVERYAFDPTFGVMDAEMSKLPCIDSSSWS